MHEESGIVEKLQNKIATLTNKLLAQEHRHREEIAMMDEKIMSMQKQINDLTDVLTKETNQNIKLDEGKKIFQELYDSSSQKLEKMAYFEFLHQQARDRLEAINIPNPKLAIEMIQKYNMDLYIHPCKTMESKTELWNEALYTQDSRVITTIIIFFSFSLEPSLFDTFVTNNQKSIGLYLQYLQLKNYDEFVLFCLKHGRYLEYVKAKLQRAMAITDIDTCWRELTECLEICERYPKELRIITTSVKCRMDELKLEQQLRLERKFD
jgi:hypothetical protein